MGSEGWYETKEGHKAEYGGHEWVQLVEVLSCITKGVDGIGLMKSFMVHKRILKVFRLFILPHEKLNIYDKRFSFVSSIDG